MTQQADPNESLLAQYMAATARQHAQWILAKDTSLSAMERVMAYARWRAAAERVKALLALVMKSP